MTKVYVIIIVTGLYAQNLMSQLSQFFTAPAGFGQSGSCEVNVNDPTYLNVPFRAPVIDATFMWLDINSGECTGTLVNRNTSDDEVGFYFITARHCVSTSETDPNAPTIDFTQDMYFAFNYQSPDGSNSSVPTTNTDLGNTLGLNGQAGYQSNLYPWSTSNFTTSLTNGFEYMHVSKVNLVDRFFWGDFALCEILTPLPPHFNVTYSGWNPSMFYDGISLGNGTSYPSTFVSTMHPEVDIKKIFGANDIWWLQTPIATGCYTITTIIDILFGWIWGHSVSTQVICNYVDIPWLTVPVLLYGANESGASGSGIFNGGNRQIGQCSGVGGSCSFPAIVEYGKLHANYYNQSIKNTLNPSNDLWVDLAGMDSRKISCYDNLVLPGAAGVSGEYFPAQDYQSQNGILLQANGTIQTTQPMNIYPNAHYTFSAGTSITLDDGFVAHAGSYFDAEIQACNNDDAFYISKPPFYDKLAQIILPKRQEFDLNAQLPEQNKISALFSLYPNPASNECTVKFNIPSGSYVNITIMDLMGRELALVDYSWHNQGTSYVHFSTANYASGVYLVKFSDGDNALTQRLMICGK